MLNPRKQGSVILEAYKVGNEKYKTATQQITHIDQDTDWTVYGVNQAVGSHPKLEPGQTYHQHGATIANPPRSSREVEAVLGEKIYDPKPDPRSREEIVLTASKQDTEIGELKNIVLQQQAQINAFIAGSQQAPTPVVKAPVVPKTEPVVKPATKLKMKDIRAIAAEQGKTIPVGKTKEEALSIISEA